MKVVAVPPGNPGAPAPAFGTLRLADLTTDRIEAWKATLTVAFVRGATLPMDGGATAGWFSGLARTAPCMLSVARMAS